MGKKYLMTPGPTPVPSQALLAQARPIIHHRTAEFSAILARVNDDLRALFRTKNDILLFASSGTGAMESAVANLFSAGDKVIVAANGKFGERFIEITSAYGLEVVKLEYEWGKMVEPADIAAALAADADIKGVFVVHSETSTGVLNNVRAIGEVVKDYPAVLIVDSITGIGAVEMRADEWRLDVVITGSQKGLMLPPGLACVSVSDKAWQAAAKSTLPKYYFSYQAARKALMKTPPTTPYTPAVSLIIGLAEVLSMMRDEGFDNVVKRHALLAAAARAGLEAMGLWLFAPPEGRGNAVTPVWVPDGVDGKKVVKKLKEKYGITVAGGQAHLAGKIIRIGHLGYFDRFDIITALAGLEMVLAELGFKLELGAGVRAAEQVFMEAEKV